MQTNDAHVHTDEQLYAALCGRDKHSGSAFTELYRRYAKNLFAYCLKILGDRGAAEDVLQETFLRLHEHAQPDRANVHVAAFLFKVARNQCLNLMKKKRAQTLTIEDLQRPADRDNADSTELLELIRMAVDILKDDYKEIFILREYNNRSYREIADITGLSLQNVKVRLFRARKEVEKILEPYIADVQKHL